MKTIALLNCHGDDVFCFRREIIEALVEKGCRVILSCPEHSRLDYFRHKEGIIIEDVQIDRRGTNPFKDIKLIWDYLRLFKKYQPDFVCYVRGHYVRGQVPDTHLQIAYLALWMIPRSMPVSRWS